MPADDYAELFVSALDLGRALKDEAGRPLGERYLPPGLRVGADTVMKACPYPGSRLGHPMNVSALPGIRRHWAEVLDDLALLRARFLTRYDLERLDWLELWCFARTVTALPAYLTRRRRTPLTVSERLSALFKPAIGIHMTCELVLFTGVDTTQQPTPADFLAQAETLGALLSQDAACSGPPDLIEEFITIALNGRTTTGALHSDWHGLVDYGRANARLEVAKAALLLSRAPERNTLRHISLSTGTVTTALDPVLARLGIRLPPTAGDPVESPAWAALLGELQSDICAALDRPKPAHPTPSDLQRTLTYLEKALTTSENVSLITTLTRREPELGSRR